MMDDYAAEAKRLSKLLDEALAYLRAQVIEWSEADDAYRMAKAKEFLSAEGSVQARQAEADLATSGERQRAHLAEGMKQAALEAVRARRTQISALQTLISATKTEMEFARTGPGGGP